jgi:hypothetical protein
MPRYDFAKVSIDKLIFKRKDIYKYLVLMNWTLKEFENVLTHAPDDAFNGFVEKHVNAYLEGTKPPAAIQTAIMNIVDDFAAGREMTLRAGDYIALQTAFQHSHSPTKA